MKTKWRVFYKTKIDEPLYFVIVEAEDRWEASKKAYRKLSIRNAVIMDVKGVIESEKKKERVTS